MADEPPVEVFCPECGYDLRGIPEGACPECGFRYDRKAILSLNREWCLNRLAELEYAVGLQVTLLAIICVPRLLSRTFFYPHVLLELLIAGVLLLGVKPSRLGWLMPVKGGPPVWPFWVLITMGGLGHYW